MKQLIVVLLMLVFFSCERTIDVSVKNQQPKLVVDAQIENGAYPLVVLSSSLNYFNTISFEELSKAFVHNAKIDISDGTTTIRLKEYGLVFSSFIYYVYSADTTGTQETFKGKLGTNYTMTIETEDGNTYQAATTVPLLTKTLDSLWWRKAPANKDSSLVNLFCRITDPPGFGNYTRYFTRVNLQPFYPGLQSVFDDQFTDGTRYDVQVDPGYDKNGEIDFTSDDYGFFHHGDTVTVRYANIDKASFDFWRTWEFNYASNDNPFSSPVIVTGNISNNALGCFTGYAAEYKTLYIPK